jgi:hypothetical protein
MVALSLPPIETPFVVVAEKSAIQANPDVFVDQATVVDRDVKFFFSFVAPWPL